MPVFRYLVQKSLGLNDLGEFAVVVYLYESDIGLIDGFVVSASAVIVALSLSSLPQPLPENARANCSSKAGVQEFCL